MKKVRKTVKKFLSNTPYEYGSVAWEVVCDPDDGYDLVQADLRITDCNHVTNIQFSSRKKKHLKYRVQKLDNLIKELQNMRKFLVSEEVAKVVEFKLKKEEKNESD